MENYEQKYKDLIARLQKAKENDDVCDERYCCVIDEIAPELTESEDERVRKEIEQLIQCMHDADPRKERWIAWLKKQGEQKPAEWSEEDESIALGIEQIVNCASLLNIAPDKLNKVRDWLKSLKERVLPQPKQEWSGEDKNNIEQAIYVCHQHGYTGVEKWLKSLKDRVQPFQYSDTERQEMFIKSQRPHFWRPSDEQMKALKYVAYHLMPDNNYREEMFSLYEDLKKLK